MDPMDHPRAPEWTEQDQQDLRKTRAGDKLRQLLLERQNDATADCFNGCSPAVGVVVGDKKISISPEEKREAAVWHNGRAAAYTEVLQHFFGGDE